jgi:tellurite resistance protein TerC
VSELWPWAVFALVLGVFLAIDLFFVQRSHGPLSLRSSAGWVALWVSVGLAFSLFVLYVGGGQAMAAYLTGYLIEYSLSADNVFVFAMLFAYFGVPAEHQRRLLFWGVLGAIVFRAIFVFGGIFLIHAFEPMIYVFGVLLVVTGLRMARSVDETLDAEGNLVLRLARRWLPVTSEFQGRSFFVRHEGRLMATPLFAALVAIELSDIIFAVDSVPAILAITTDPFVVLTSNGFAVLGLRSLYFLLAGMMGRFIYLRFGLAAILVIAGAKMLLSEVVEVPTVLSLVLIVSILAVTLIASLWVTRRRPLPDATPPDPAELRAELKDD